MHLATVLEYRFVTYLFILEMTVFALNGVKLVTQSEEVLVSLLDLEDLCLKLRNEQVFLV